MKKNIIIALLILFIWAILYSYKQRIYSMYIFHTVTIMDVIEQYIQDDAIYIVW